MNFDHMPQEEDFYDKKLQSIESKFFELKIKNQLLDQIFNLYSYYDLYIKNKNKYEYCIKLRQYIIELDKKAKKLSEIFVIGHFMNGKCEDIYEKEKKARDNLEKIVRGICYECERLFKTYEEYSNGIKKLDIILNNSSFDDLKLVLDFFDIEYINSIYPILKTGIINEINNKLEECDINKLKEILTILNIEIERPDTLYFDEKRATIEAIKNNINKLNKEELDTDLNLLNIKKENMPIYLSVKDKMIEKIKNHLFELYNLDNVIKERINYNKYNLKDIFCYKLVAERFGELYPQFYLKNPNNTYECYDMTDWIYGKLNWYSFKISFKILKNRKNKIEDFLNTFNKELSELSYYKFILEEYSKLTGETLLWGQSVNYPIEASLSNFDKLNATDRNAFDIQRKMITIYYLIKEYNLESLFSNNEVFKMLEDCEKEYNKENDSKIKVKSK